MLSKLRVNVICFLFFVVLSSSVVVVLFVFLSQRGSQHHPNQSLTQDRLVNQSGRAPLQSPADGSVAGGGVGGGSSVAVSFSSSTTTAAAAAAALSHSGRRVGGGAGSVLSQSSTNGRAPLVIPPLPRVLFRPPTAPNSVPRGRGSSSSPFVATKHSFCAGTPPRAPARGLHHQQQTQQQQQAAGEATSDLSFVLGEDDAADSNKAPKNRARAHPRPRQVGHSIGAAAAAAEIMAGGGGGGGVGGHRALNGAKNGGGGKSRVARSVSAGDAGVAVGAGWGRAPAARAASERDDGFNNNNGNGGSGSGQGRKAGAASASVGGSGSGSGSGSSSGGGGGGRGRAVQPGASGGGRSRSIGGGSSRSIRGGGGGGGTRSDSRTKSLRGRSLFPSAFSGNNSSSTHNERRSMSLSALPSRDEATDGGDRRRRSERQPHSGYYGAKGGVARMCSVLSISWMWRGQRGSKGEDAGGAGRGKEDGHRERGRGKKRSVWGGVRGRSAHRDNNNQNTGTTYCIKINMRFRI